MRSAQNNKINQETKKNFIEEIILPIHFTLVIYGDDIQ